MLPKAANLISYRHLAFGAELDERLFIQRWLARHFSFPVISVTRRFARQRVAECVGCGEISFQGLDGIDSQDGLQVSLVRRPSVWMRNKSPVK